MGARITIKKNKIQIKLYYMGAYIGKIQVAEDNKTKAASLDLSLHSDIKIERDYIDKDMDKNYNSESD